MAQRKVNQYRKRADDIEQDKIGTSDFYRQHKLRELAAEQGVEPITDPTELFGDFWPEEETTEEFITTLREWRRGEAERREL